MFGETLEKLLEQSGVKQYLLAQTLQYDASYISKWISGASLPSEKNSVVLSRKIGAFIADNAPDDAAESLCRTLDVDRRQDLAQAVTSALLEAYGDSAGARKPVRKSGDVSFVVNPTGERVLCGASRKRLNLERPVRIVIFADLYQMSRNAKLELAGIENGRFTVRRKLKNLRLDMVIPFPREEESSVYHTILIIHMLANYSRLNFSLYAGEYARGKIACAVDRSYVFTTLLGDSAHCLSNTLCTNAGAAEQAYAAMTSMINPECLLFLKTDLNAMLRDQYYAQSVLSPNLRWLMGHMTEQLLPRDLFDGLLAELPVETPLREHMEKGFSLTANVLGFTGARVMVYETAITNYALTGELDFFNRRLTVSAQRRLLHLTYLRELLEREPLRFQLIRRGFSDDFQQITNPCVFLSDTTGYLRLENGAYEDNILLINGARNRANFDGFFEQIWVNGGGVTYDDRQAIGAFIDHQIDTLRMLIRVEEAPRAQTDNR